VQLSREDSAEHEAVVNSLFFVDVVPGHLEQFSGSLNESFFTNAPFWGE